MTPDRRALRDGARAWLVAQLRWERALECLRHRRDVADGDYRDRPAA